MEDGEEFGLTDGGVQFGSLKDLMAHDIEPYSKQQRTIASQIPAVSDMRMYSDAESRRNLPEYGTKLPMKRFDIPDYNLRPTYPTVASEAAAQARHIEESRNPFSQVSDIPQAPPAPEPEKKKVSFAEEIAAKRAERLARSTPTSSAPSTSSTLSVAPTATHTTHYIGYPVYTGYSPLLYKRLYDWGLGYIPEWYTYSERRMLENAIESLLKKELVNKTDENLLKSIIKKFLDEKIGKPAASITKVKTSRKKSKKTSKKRSKTSKKSPKKKSPKKKSPKKKTSKKVSKKRSKKTSRR